MNAVDKVLYFSTKRAQDRGWHGITGFMSSLLIHSFNISLLIITVVGLLIKAGVLAPIHLDGRVLPIAGFALVYLALYAASSGYSAIMEEGSTLPRSSPYSTISKWTAGRGLVVVGGAMIVLL